METSYEPDKFLKQTDALTSKCSAEQLVAFIHESGRVCPEHRREGFLEMLKSVGRQPEKAGNKKEAGFDEMYSHIRDNLRGIDSQEITITAVLSEEYDDGHDDSGEEFYYEDNSGISDMLEGACEFVHIMQRGDEELPEFEEFLPFGVTYLDDKTFKSC